MRPIVACFALGLLSACVLHSKEPLFTDADATLVLSNEKLILNVQELKDGKWVDADEPRVTAIPEENHYLVPDPDTPDDLQSADIFSFIALDNFHFVVQAMTGGEADYALATWDGYGQMLVQALDCGALKDSGQAGDLVEFTDDTCALKPSDTPRLDVFRQLMPAAPAAALSVTKDTSF